ncbi:hypothetical protein MLB1_19750 [Mycobacteroides sp. LB1]|nr:hypothetical protein [Mycobacteroides sp. LB1]
MAVVAAVDAVLAGLPVSNCSVSSVAQAWMNAAGRSLTIQDVVLPAGVFGRWLSLPDRDVVQVGIGVVGRDRTIAHELGHMVLGHRGRPVTEYVEGLVQAASSDLIAHMLQRACCDDNQAISGVWRQDEVAAEWFAGLLTRRVEAGYRRRPGWGHGLDDAIG